MPGNGKIIFPPQGTSLNSVVAIENFMESTEAVTNLSSAQLMNPCIYIYTYIYIYVYIYIQCMFMYLGQLTSLETYAKTGPASLVIAL